MARVKIELPEGFAFVATIPIRITDINYGRHVGNDALLSIIHEARMQFLNYHQLSELDFAGTGLIMSDVAIEFRSESYYGDVLEVSVTAADVGRVGFDLVYKLAKKETGTLVALAKTGMVCFDYGQKKVARLPEAALLRLNGR